MNALVEDARVALRGLRRSPTFTVTAVLILGLGIGMAAAMWTVFNAVLLRQLPVESPDRIVLPRSLDQAGVDVALSAQDVDRLRRESRTMREIAGYAHFESVAWPMAEGDRPLVLNGAQVDGNFFEMLGVRPVIGRLLRSGADTASQAMVLSYGAWQRQFGGDPAILGRRLTETISEKTYTIVGVAPAGLAFPTGADYWIFPPFRQFENIVARLAPNATPAAAQAEFAAIVGRIDGERTAKFNIRTADIRTLTTAVVGNVRPVLIVLLGAVALLLVIACVNVGNLLLLRAAMRSRELAIRRALGASYGDLVRQLLVESALLAAAGGALGLLCADIARRVLIAAAPPHLPRLDAVRVTGVPIGAAAGVAVVSVLLFGILPALTAARGSPASPIRLDERSGSTTRQRRNVRQLLVASQIALAVIMLAGAGLLARSLRQLETLDLGYRADHLSILQLSFPASRYADDAKLFGLLEAVSPRIAAVPGVTGQTPVLIPPFLGPNFWTGVWQADWQSQDEAASNAMIPSEAGGTDYFRTFEIPIVRGRGFLDTDRENSTKVVVVSEAIARRYWPGQDPIGKRMRFDADTEPWRTVVGVAGETHFRSLREAVPMIYLPWRQSQWQGLIAVRTSSSLSATLPAIRRAIQTADPRATVWRARTMDDLLTEPLAQPRLSAVLMSGFGLVALLLAAIGLYGIMASAVREQTREIGVRMALGATPDRVRQDVLRRALGVAAAGTAVGIVGALATSRILGSLLFEVSPTDPIALSGACVVLLAVAAVAAYIPARRATTIQPASALRAD
jgi:putative ABC transport system permease protein